MAAAAVVAAMIALLVRFVVVEWSSLKLMFAHLGVVGVLLTLGVLGVGAAMIALLVSGRATKLLMLMPAPLADAPLRVPRAIFCSVIARRGGSHPRGTLAAFKAALREGADLIVADVWYLPRSDVIVVGDAANDAAHQYHQHTLKALRRMQAAAPTRVYRVPTLAQLLRTLQSSGNGGGALLHLHGDGWTATRGLDALRRRVNAAHMARRVRVASADVALLASVGDYLPDVPLMLVEPRGAGRGSRAAVLKRVQDAGAWEMLLSEGRVDKHTVNALRVRGVDVTCAMYGAPHESVLCMRQAVDAGVTALLTERPAPAVALLTMMRDE